MLNDFSNFVCAVSFYPLIMECFHPAEISLLKIPNRVNNGRFQGMFYQGISGNYMYL